MKQSNIKLQTLKCKRCNHNWIPRQLTRNHCPKCKSPYWDKDRKK